MDEQIEAELEKLAACEEWEIGPHRIAIMKMSLKDGIGAQTRLSRLLGPALAAMVSGTVKKDAVIEGLIKGATERAIHGDTAEVREGLKDPAGEVVTKLGEHIGSTLGEALERFIFTMGDKESEADVYWLLERFMSISFLIKPSGARVKLRDVGEALFRARYDLLYRFLGAAIVRNFGSFLAVLGVMKVLQDMGLPVASSYPTGSNGPTATESPTESQPPASTTTLTPSFSTSGH